MEYVLLIGFVCNFAIFRYFLIVETVLLNANI